MADADSWKSRHDRKEGRKGVADKAEVGGTVEIRKDDWATTGNERREKWDKNYWGKAVVDC